jgi:ABC-type amino acid transport substrate-binding protein
MKLPFSKLIRILGLAALVAAPIVKPASADTLDDARKAGVLRVGVALMGLKPFIWQDPATGEYHGFENDILKDLIKKLGIPKYEYVVTDWSTLVPGLKAKRWDIIMSGMVRTEQRTTDGGFLMSDPYFFVYDRIIVKTPSTIKSESDLAGKTLGTPLGSVDALVAQNLVDKKVAGSVKTFNSFAEPFIALENGQVDAVILDQMDYMGQKNRNPAFTAIGDPLYYITEPKWQSAQDKADYRVGGNSIGVRTDDTRLLTEINKDLAELDASGGRETIMKAYGAWDDNQTRKYMMKQ